MNNRRDFIKISALGIGGVALAGTSIGLIKGKSLFSANESSKITDNRRFKNVPTYCEVCFWKCAGWVHVDEQDRIIKITGNKADPHCNGRLCPRGTGGVGMYYDEDRLKTPLIRTGQVGQQTYREATWEEALDYDCF